MKTALKLIAALFFYAAFSISSTSAAEPEKMFFQKDNVTLVVILARDTDCCNYAESVKATGWKSTPSKTKNQYTCYLTIGEVDVALACYQGQNPERIGTRVVDINLEGDHCPTDTVRLLAGAGVSNLIQDFKRDGYPDGWNDRGCPGPSG